MSFRVTLIGRAEHLSQLDRLRADCLSGNGRVALVSGPVGCGKTELLHIFAEQSSNDFRFLKATCSPAERALPLGVVGQLLPDRAGRFAGDGLDPSVASHALLLHDVSRALTGLARDTPLLIGVDDVHHADAPSLACLLHVARRLDTARIVLVLTEVDQPRTPFHAELVRERHCRRVRLSTLSQDQLAELAGPLAAEVHLLTGGNPLLARALVEDHAATGRLFGPAFREDLLACVRRGGPDVAALAAGLAVLGEDPSPVLLAQLTGVDVVRSLHGMEAAGLVADGWFRHPAAASLILGDLSRRDLGDLHLSAARLLHEQGASPPEVAHHLESADLPHAGERQLPEWAAAVLGEAAEHALREGDVDRAVAHLERATRTGTDDRTRAVLRSRLSRVEWRTNPSTAARHFPALLTASTAGHLGPWDEVSLLRQLLWHGRFPEAHEVLDRARASGSLPPAVELWLGCAYPRTSGRAGLPDLALTADTWARATTALAQVLTGRCAEEAVVTAEQILQGARANGVSDYRVAALLTLVHADRLDAAATWCDRLLAAAHGKRADTLVAMLAATRAEIAVRQGDLHAAQDHADTALRLVGPDGWGTYLGHPLSCALLAATWSGRLDDATRLVELPVPEPMFETRAGVHYLHARGRHHLATGREHAALADFLVVGELVCSWGLDAPGLVAWRTGAAEAWLRQDKRDRARSLVLEQLALATEPSRARGAALRLLASCEDVSRRVALLTEAVEVLEQCGDRYELARALGDLSRVHHALGDQRRARMGLRRAWHVAKECDALPLCRELLPDVQPQTAGGPDALSDAERRVAALAATGDTNREIADKLFITPSTVEQHLTRVYRKLNVKDRTDLPMDMASTA